MYLEEVVVKAQQPDANVLDLVEREAVREHEVARLDHHPPRLGRRSLQENHSIEIVLAQPAVDLYLHDGYFVVAHFHLIMGIAALFGIFAAMAPLANSP